MNGDRLDVWMQTATKFFVLANAGGAVAVLSFVGTRSSSDLLIGVLAVAALICFTGGLVIAGIVIGAQLTGAYRAFLSSGGPKGVAAVSADQSIKNAWVTRKLDKVEPRTGTFLLAAFSLFVIGAALGILGLAVSVFSSPTRAAASNLSPFKGVAVVEDVDSFWVEGPHVRLKGVDGPEVRSKTESAPHRND